MISHLLFIYIMNEYYAKSVRKTDYAKKITPPGALGNFACFFVNF